MNISIILPARNEALSLSRLLPELKKEFPSAEIIVVNDGSEDNTTHICQNYAVNMIEHPYSKGNGAAIKSGARVAKGDVLVFMDADGQHLPSYIKELISGIENGFDMVVGARGRDSQAGLARCFANSIYNALASYMSGHKIRDLTSGFRAVRADTFKQFLYLLPNGFSYPTTITMALFRSGYSINYIPIKCDKRSGTSHIRLLKDGFKFFLIIFRVTSLYSPLKIFAPVSFGLLLTGLSYYGFTYMYQGRFTNMSMLLLISSIIVFLIGLISEQITFLIYSQNQKK